MFAVTAYLSSEPLYFLVPRLIMHGTVFSRFLPPAAQEIPARNATACECALSHGEWRVATTHPASIRSKTAEYTVHLLTTRNAWRFCSVCCRTACRLYQQQSRIPSHSQQSPAPPQTHVPNTSIFWSAVKSNVLMTKYIGGIDNFIHDDARKVWSSCGSVYCTCLTRCYP